MKTTLEIVVALATSILFSGAMIAASVVAVLLASAGGLWCVWRLLRPRK